MHKDKSPSVDLKKRLTNCVACKSGNIYKWKTKSYFYTSKLNAVNFDIYICGNCKTGFLNPPPEKEFLNEIYKFSGHGLVKEIKLSEILERESIFPNTTTDAIRLTSNADRLNISSNKNALDIGSGYGFYTFELNKIGYRTKSINPGKYENEVFKELCGYYPVVGMFDDITFSDYYGVIIMSQVLEHITNPEATIKRISGILSSGGIIACAVPNFHSFNVKLRGINDNSCLWIPEHVNYFTFKGLINIFNNNGYEIVSHNYITRIPYDVLTKRVHLPKPVSSACDRVLKASLKYFNNAVDSTGLGLYINVYARKK